MWGRKRDDAVGTAGGGKKSSTRRGLAFGALVLSPRASTQGRSCVRGRAPAAVPDPCSAIWTRMTGLPDQQHQEEAPGSATAGMAAASAVAGDGGAAEWPGVLFTEAFKEKVRSARVLAVGAGGIGCELLKTLVLSGFENIEVIDLDTIETSNLNRQFLFRRSHVGQSKAQVAADVVRTFAPHARLKAYQANVKEGRFGLDFIRSFDLVLNGLDNMDARRHVNRLCVAAGVPLVESGTAGFVGQVSVHLKGSTECYECQPRTNAAQKTYPICTLRNTPDKPIHCVVWAKELLFPRLFGRVEVSDLDEGAAAAPAPAATAAHAPAENGGAHGAEEAARAAAEEAAEAASFYKMGDGEEPLQYAARVFDRLYRHDINNVVSMEELWKSRAPPSPLVLESLLPAGDLAPGGPLAAAAASPAASASRALGLQPTELWPAADAARVLLASVAKFVTQRRGELGSAAFDKDDDLAVDVVAAASNLRATCYGIPQQTAFDAKGMAGNIIHAIATTNAIVGGIIVAEALKLLAGRPDKCVTSFLRTEPSWVGSRRSGRVLGLIYGEVPSQPRPECMVCGKAQLQLTTNTRAMALQQLVDKVLKQRLAVNLPALNTAGGFWYEEGEDLEEDEAAASRALLPRALADLPGGGLVHGTILSVGDHGQALSLDVIISHQDSFDEEQCPEGFVLEGQVPQAAAEEPGAAQQQEQQQQEAAAGRPKKRARDDGGEEGGPQPAAAEQEEQQQDAGEVAAAKRQRQGGEGGGPTAQAGGQQEGVADEAAAAAAAGEGTADEPVDLVSEGEGEEDGDIILD